jgi:hypothetical protein
LCKHIIRTKVKGTRFKAASDPDHEPDFYSMPFVTPLSVGEDVRRDLSQTSWSTKEEDVRRDLSQTSSSSSTSSSDPIPEQSLSLNTISYNCELPDSYVTCESLRQFQTPYCKAEMSINSPPGVPAVNSEEMNDINNQDVIFEEECLDWDESFDDAFEMSLKDDIQLGFMLEKLLEE